MSVNPALATLSGLGAEAEEKLVGFNWLENAHGEFVALQIISKGSSRRTLLSSGFSSLLHIGETRANIFISRGSVTRKGWQRRGFYAS